jgi:hypothetical protein
MYLGRRRKETHIKLHAVKHRKESHGVQKHLEDNMDINCRESSMTVSTAGFVLTVPNLRVLPCTKKRKFVPVFK